MDLKKATGKDHAVVIDLLAKLYTELGEEKESVLFLSPGLLSSILESGRTEIYLVMNEQTVIGILTLTESQAIYAGGTYGVIDELYIEPGHREMGHGKKILKQVSAIAKERGWARVDVTAPTGEEWKRTAAFYETNGFAYTGPKFKLRV